MGEETRKEIIIFGTLMESKLQEYEKADWEYSTFGSLLDELNKNVTQLQRDMINGIDYRTQGTAADIANYCMMIHDKISKKGA